MKIFNSLSQPSACELITGFLCLIRRASSIIRRRLSCDTAITSVQFNSSVLGTRVLLCTSRRCFIIEPVWVCIRNLSCTVQVVYPIYLEKLHSPCLTVYRYRTWCWWLGLSSVTDYFIIEDDVRELSSPVINMELYFLIFWHRCYMGIYDGQQFSLLKFVVRCHLIFKKQSDIFLVCQSWSWAIFGRYEVWNGFLY